MPSNVNIFSQYGIKEVANVYFEALDDDIAAGVYKGDIVLYLDTLKVSTIETSAENVAAQGGWGNPKLIQWDYGKELNVTLEDALMSLESLRFMLGGAIKKDPTVQEPIIVRHTEEVVCTDNGVMPLPKDHLTGITFGAITASVAHPVKLINLTTGVRTQLTSGTIDGTKPINFKNPKLAGAEPVQSAQGDHIRIFWEEVITNNNGNETAVEVTISPDTFPGTYKIVGDTVIRAAETGKDEPFQFIINKAKVQSNVTLTLQAEGDPTTFEMTLNVLRSTNDAGENEMMKLVRYNISGTTSSASSDDIGSVVGGS